MPRINVTKLYREKKRVKQAKKPATGENVFHIHIAILNFSRQF